MVLKLEPIRMLNMYRHCEKDNFILHIKFKYQQDKKKHRYSEFVPFKNAKYNPKDVPKVTPKVIICLF